MSSLRDNYGSISGTKTPFIRHATNDGLVSGSIDAAINGSVTPVKFYIQPAVDEVFEILSTVLVVSSLASNPAIGKYGNNDLALTNGVQFFIEQDGVETILGSPIIDNADLAGIYAANGTYGFASSINLRTYRADLPNAFILRGKTSDKYGIIVQDDLSTLNTHNLNLVGLVSTQV